MRSQSRNAKRSQESPEPIDPAPRSINTMMRCLAEVARDSPFFANRLLANPIETLRAASWLTPEERDALTIYFTQIVIGLGQPFVPRHYPVRGPGMPLVPRHYPVRGPGIPLVPEDSPPSAFENISPWAQADSLAWPLLVGHSNVHTGVPVDLATALDSTSPWQTGRLTDVVVTSADGIVPAGTIVVVSDAGIWSVTTDGIATVLGDFAGACFTAVTERDGIIYAAGGTLPGGAGGTAVLYAGQLLDGEATWFQFAMHDIPNIADMTLTPSKTMLLATSDGVWIGQAILYLRSLPMFFFDKIQGSPSNAFTTIAYTGPFASISGETAELAVTADFAGAVYIVYATPLFGPPSFLQMTISPNALSPPAQQGWVGVDSANTSVVYAQQNQDANIGQPLTLWRSTDGGFTWENFGPTGVTNGRTGRPAAYGKTVVAGGESWSITQNLFPATTLWGTTVKSFANYPNWDQTNYEYGVSHLHQDINSIRFFPVRGEMTMFICSDGGLVSVPVSNVSENGPWSSGYNKGLLNFQIQCQGTFGFTSFTGRMDVDRNSGGEYQGYYVAAGMQDNGVLVNSLEPGGAGYWRNFPNYFAGDGLSCAIMPLTGSSSVAMVAREQVDKDINIVYGAPPLTPQALPITSTLAFPTGAQLDQYAPIQAFGSPNSWFSDSDDTVCAVTGGYVWYQGLNYGNYLFVLRESASGNVALSVVATIVDFSYVVAVCGAHNGQLFACSADGQIWVVDPGGSSSSGFPAGATSEYGFAPPSRNFLCSFAAGRDGAVYLGVGGLFEGPSSVFQRSNLGVWTEISNGLFGSDPVTSITVDDNVPATLFVATTQGVFVYSDGQWFSASSGMPSAIWCTNLSFARNSVGDAMLYVGTYGRGVWRAYLSL